MKYSPLAVIAAAFVTVCLAANVASAQQTQPPAQSSPRSAPVTTHGVAVIDVTFILDHYNKLNQAKAAFKADAERAEADLKKDRDAIAKRAEAIKQFKSGTPDYKREEEAITKLESDWKLKVAAQRRDFGERESQTFLKAYRELSAVVKNYSDRNGISLVLRFTGAPFDPTNREMVQMEIFKMVMYYDKNIDITEPILAEMNRGTAAVATPPRSTQGTRVK